MRTIYSISFEREINCNFYFERRTMDYRYIYYCQMYLEADFNNDSYEMRVNIHLLIGFNKWIFWGSKKLYQSNKGYFIIHRKKRIYLMEI